MVTERENRPGGPEAFLANSIPREEAWRLYDALGERGAILRQPTTPEASHVLIEWGRQDNFPLAKVAAFFRNQLTPKGEKEIQARAEEAELDLQNDSDFLAGLKLLSQENRIPEEGIRAKLRSMIPTRPILEGEVLLPENQPRAITPWAGEFLKRLQSTSSFLLDPELRQMTLEAAKEWLETGLVLTRSRNDQEKARALRTQLISVEETLARALGKPVDWGEIFENGLKFYYEMEKTPLEKRFGLFTPQGMAIALKEFYPQLAAAVLAAPEVAGENADRIVAITVEDNRAKLAMRKEKNQRELGEFQKESERALKRQEIEVEKEVGQLYAEASPVLERVAEVSRELSAIAESTWATIARVVIRECSKIPVAIPGGFLEQIKEEASKNKPAAAGAFVGLVGGTGAVVYFGLPWPTVAGITVASSAGGALLAGILKPEEEKPLRPREG